MKRRLRRSLIVHKFFQEGFTACKKKSTDFYCFKTQAGWEFMKLKKIVEISNFALGS